MPRDPRRRSRSPSISPSPPLYGERAESRERYLDSRRRSHYPSHSYSTSSSRPYRHRDCTPKTYDNRHAHRSAYMRDSSLEPHDHRSHCDDWNSSGDPHDHRRGHRSAYHRDILQEHHDRHRGHRSTHDRDLPHEPHDRHRRVRQFDRPGEPSPVSQADVPGRTRRLGNLLPKQREQQRGRPSDLPFQSDSEDPRPARTRRGQSARVEAERILAKLEHKAALANQVRSSSPQARRPVSLSTQMNSPEIQGATPGIHMTSQEVQGTTPGIKPTTAYTTRAPLNHPLAEPNHRVSPGRPLSNPTGRNIMTPRTKGDTSALKAELEHIMNTQCFPNDNRIPTEAFGAGWGGQQVFAHNYGGTDGCSLGLCFAVFSTAKKCKDGARCSSVHAWPSGESIAYILQNPNPAMGQKAKQWIFKAFSNWLFHHSRNWLPARQEPLPPRPVHFGSRRGGRNNRSAQSFGGIKEPPKGLETTSGVNTQTSGPARILEELSSTKAATAADKANLSGSTSKFIKSTPGVSICDNSHQSLTQPGPASDQGTRWNPTKFKTTIEGSDAEYEHTKALAVQFENELQERRTPGEVVLSVKKEAQDIQTEEMEGKGAEQ